MKRGHGERGEKEGESAGGGRRKTTLRELRVWIGVIGMTKTAEQIIAEAVQAGIDLELVEHNLTLSPEERARQHDEALKLVLELRRTGEEMRARDRQAA